MERHRARAVQGPERVARPRRRGARRERLRRRPRGRGHLPARLDPFRLQEARPPLLVHLARARAGADRPRPRQAPLRLRRPRRRRRGQGQGGLARGPQRLARPIVPLRRLAPVRRPRPDPDAGAGRRADPRDPRLQIGPLLPGGVLGRQDGARASRRREAEDPSGGRAPRPCGRRVAVRDLQGRAQAGEVPRAQALRPHRAATRRIDARGPHRGGNAERAANAVREEAGDISQDREPLHRRVRHPRDGPRALGHRGAGNRRRGRRGRVRRVALRRRPRGRRLEGPRPRRDPAHGAARRQGDGQARWRRARRGHPHLLPPHGRHHGPRDEAQGQGRGRDLRRRLHGLGQHRHGRVLDRRGRGVPYRAGRRRQGPRRRGRGAGHPRRHRAGRLVHRGRGRRAREGRQDDPAEALYGRDAAVGHGARRPVHRGPRAEGGHRG